MRPSQRDGWALGFEQSLLNAYTWTAESIATNTYTFDQLKYSSPVWMCKTPKKLGWWYEYSINILSTFCFTTYFSPNSYHLGPKNVPPKSFSHQHLGLPTEMSWDQPPQKHCATAVYLDKTSWGFDLQIISTLQCTNLWILKILKLILSASKGLKNRFQCDSPHLAQHAVPPWQREDLSFQLMASGAAEAPKLLELKKSGTKNFPHLSRLWNRFVDWNLHLKKKRWKKMCATWNRWGFFCSRSQKNSDIYALIFIIHGSFLNWKTHWFTPRNG